MRKPQQATSVWYTSWPVIAMVAGLVLMVLAPLIVGAAPEGTLALWSDADQALLQKASADFHAASNFLADVSRSTFIAKGAESYDPVAAKARQAAAKAELDKQQARLKSAQSRPTWLLWTLRLLGIAAAAIGVWGYYRGRADLPTQRSID
jgi:hypothetical protein